MLPIPPEMMAMALQQVLGTEEGRRNAVDSITAFLRELGISGVTIGRTEYSEDQPVLWTDPEQLYDDSILSYERYEYRSRFENAAEYIIERLSTLTKQE